MWRSRTSNAWAAMAAHWVRMAPPMRIRGRISWSPSMLTPKYSGVVGLKAPGMSVVAPSTAVKTPSRMATPACSSVQTASPPSRCTYIRNTMGWSPVTGSPAALAKLPW